MSYLASKKNDEMTSTSPGGLKITYIPRFLAKGFAVSPYEDGPLVNHPEGSLSEEQLVAGKMPISGIIVGEGDTGKTWLTKRLAKLTTEQAPVKVFPLRRYGITNPHLLDHVSQFITDTENCSCRTVVIDGLDENLDAAGAIERLCDSYLSDTSTVRFWITSRPRNAVNQLLSRIPRLHPYYLLPFTYDDLKCLTNGAGLDCESFRDELAKTRLLDMAKKPGGAVLLMDLFVKQKGRLSDDRNELLYRIVQSLVGARRDGVAVPPSETCFSETMLLEAAGWTATRFWLEQKDSVWDGAAYDCPPTALPFGALECGVYVVSDLSELLKRRLFEPLDQNRYRFVADETLTKFLTAWWLNLKSGGHVKDLFETKSGIGFALGGVMSYLAWFHPNQADDWLSCAPRFFSNCHQAIKAFGKEKLFDALNDYQKRAPWDSIFVAGGNSGRIITRPFVSMRSVDFRVLTCRWTRRSLP